ncbi:MAG: glycine--tRNA ligase subunit beta [Aquisalinus sp.]|nr:glycine--tRNA ligase subunit beta [Aquisalinus sp.]
MPDLLLEIFSEEIPARMQPRAAADLQKLVQDELFAAGFMPEGAKAFATPRRLALVVTGLPGAQADRKEEKKGPRVGAPEKAVAGFLKSAGLDSIDACEVRSDKKGEFYVAVIDEKGRPTADVIAGFLPELIRKFPWPKSMRWGDGELRWVRPMHSILCTFDGEIVPFEVEGIASGDRTHGHRFMASDEIQVRNFEDYEIALSRAKVVLDGERRTEQILEEAKALCATQGLELVEDAGLLSEVAGLAEWPVTLMGSFDEKFLELPDEVLTATMKGHQKYFSVRDPKTDALTNRFVFVSNIEAPDGGKAMRAGYERVLTARLSDAWFLYSQDLKTPLEEHAMKLDDITYFEGLGSIGSKVYRMAEFAEEFAKVLNANPSVARKAAELVKADLVTKMVYEFPELQGIVGAQYAKSEGIDPEIVVAIRNHYKPNGSSDDLPVGNITKVVALAEKLHDLTAFWSIGIKPSGSSDPYALRRAALGVLRIMLEGVRSPLRPLLKRYFEYRMPLLATDGWNEILEHQNLTNSSVGAAVSPEHPNTAHFSGLCSRYFDIEDAMQGLFELHENGHSLREAECFTSDELSKVNANDIFNVFCAGMPGHLVDERKQDYWDRAVATYRMLQLFKEKNQWMESDGDRGYFRTIEKLEWELVEELLTFFHDRLKVYLKDKGHRHDHVDAVRIRPDGTLEDDLVLIVKKLGALEAFLKTGDGENLLAAYKRAGNILKAEEKKEGKSFELSVDEALLKEGAEQSLHAAMVKAQETFGPAIEQEDFSAAMSALAALRAPLDAFFEDVTVNAEDEDLRRNRLALLASIKQTCEQVADFSRIEG